MNAPEEPMITAREGQRPPRATRLLVTAVIFCAVALASLWIGHRFGDRIGETGRQMWAGIFGSKVEDKHEENDTFYTCGMHPWVILPRPGPCPICHMDLTPLDPSKFTGEIAIDPVVVQNIGVRTALVETGPLVRTVRTVGKITYDETRLHDVNLKVAGWIEKLLVDYLGADVKAGDPLFELYSPELFSAQQEYILALEHREMPGVPFVPRVAMDADAGMNAARTRLSFFGIDEPQIAELERTKKPMKTMTIKSPFTGTVIKKMAVAGMRVNPGMQMYRIADLSKVWVDATVYEYQLPYVELGQDAQMSLPYVPGQRFSGKVTYIYPWTDEKTREVTVRLEFPNETGLLKPGMFANVDLRKTLADSRTLVDRSAIIDTGERQIAFVSLGNGRFEPRELRLGVESESGRVEVLDGLAPGERVVTSAQFLIDSESKIKEALMRLVRGGLAGEEDRKSPGPELPSIPKPLAAALRSALDGYLAVQDALARDETSGIERPARAIAGAASAMLEVSLPEDPHFWHRHDEVATIRGKALEIAGAKDLAAARLSFTDLSVGLGKLLRATGVPAAIGDLEELHCPMFLENQGGSVWLQKSGVVRNPYFGAKMLGCFDKRTALAPAGAPGGAAAPAAGGATVQDPLAAIDAMVDAYLRAADALANDRFEGLPRAWKDLRSAVEKLPGGHARQMGSRIHAAIPSDDLDPEATRKSFQALSAAAIDFLKMMKPSKALKRAYCPMVKASWLQLGDEIRNPYMGRSMIDCGSIEETLPARQEKNGR
ncbi:MAG: hypothetical protein Fur0037_28390 [Planctomycetota bacterium]